VAARAALPAVVLTLLVCGFALAAGTSTAAVRGPILNRIRLTAAQVGPGYLLRVVPDGRCVGASADCATLDLCAAAYPSERLRTARLQVGYSHAGKASPLSNEVVTYRPGGAAQGLRELVRAVDNCPKGPVKGPLPGLKLTYRFSRVTDSNLLPGYVALRLRLTGTAKGETHSVTGFAVYQVKGDVLSAVYSYLGDATTRRTTLHAAEEIAKNLNRWA
jgi:hypothetical protein